MPKPTRKQKVADRERQLKVTRQAVRDAITLAEAMHEMRKQRPSCKRYLATMGHGTTEPINHGEVTLYDDGFVVTAKDPEPTPIEDFGMYIYQEQPFTETRDELFDRFIALIAEAEESTLK